MVAYEFPIEGGAISQNHGYEMLSALSKVAPFIHGRSDVQIAPVGGFRLNSGKIIPQGHSRLHIRGLTPEEAMSLAGKSITLEGTLLNLGGVTPRELIGTPRLASRIVLFNGIIDQVAFITELSKIVRGITLGKVKIEVGRCRALKIQGVNLLGYSVELQGLSPEASLKIQGSGIGHGTSMGCGVFRSY